MAHRDKSQSPEFTVGIDAGGSKCSEYFLPPSHGRHP
jgi:hypothetical protein